MTPVAPPPAVVPVQGAVIARSAVVRAGTYLLKGGETTPALTVRGEGIVVDFSKAILRGTPATVAPDERRGIGLLVEGSNVTIKGLHAHGYKIGLLARGVKGLRLIDCDLSYNWRQHLRSTPDREDPADWMSFHHNEHGEWLEHGVGAYLDRCDGFEVRGLHVTGGESGLFLDRSNHGLVWNSDLSFNSALGIGMYRASDDRIMHNRIDYDVRGFSYGVYNRGQDSAGILVFEQCNRNLFAYNSVTHGGDGFFLWAGQETMDTGKGGCNDNLCYANDFSYAPTNAIEATFSRNKFVGNRVYGAFHGLWGGYSYDTKIIGNDFRDNQRGVAIEHGQANEIAFNRFDGEDVAIALWADRNVDPNLGYARARDVRSRDNRIVGNELFGVALAIDLRGDTNALLQRNFSADVPLQRVPTDFNREALPAPDRGEPGRIERVPYPKGPKPTWNPLDPLRGRNVEGLTYHVPPLQGGQMPFLKPSDPQGWSTILVDEWGPYDGRRPLLWPERVVEGGAPLPGGTSPGSGLRKAGTVRETGRFRILGPKGRWRLVSAQGATFDAKTGVVPGFVKIDFPKGRVGLAKVELEYVGAATTDVRGIVTPAGKPVRFGFSRFRAPIDWNVRFFSWKVSENPADPDAPPKEFDAVKKGTPLRTLLLDRLDFAGYAFAPGLPRDHFATVADGSFTVPAGDYALEVVTDDGARVWLDGKPILADAWHYQGPTSYPRTLHLAAGAHHLHVEHFQIDGYATLKVALGPAP